MFSFENHFKYCSTTLASHVPPKTYIFHHYINFWCNDLNFFPKMVPINSFKVFSKIKDVRKLIMLNYLHFFINCQRQSLLLLGNYSTILSSENGDHYSIGHGAGKLEYNTKWNSQQARFSMKTRHNFYNVFGRWIWLFFRCRLFYSPMLLD